MLKQKTARFNYLQDKEGEEKGKFDSEKYEYKHIINKLTKEHHYQNVLKEYYKKELNQQKREGSPFMKKSGATEQKKNSQIKSIILKQSISLQRKKTQKNESSLQKKDAYLMIKESHIMKDEQFNKIYENSLSPNYLYLHPPEETKPSSHKYSYNPIKFYQFKLEHTPPRKKMTGHKNNQPYINQLYSEGPSNTGKNTANPEYRLLTPSKLANLSESQLKRNNGAYRAQKSRQKIADISKNRLYTENKKDKNKRSCYDYVPKQLRQRLTRTREHQY